MKGVGAGAQDKSPTAKQRQFDALDMVGVEKMVSAATERTSNHGDVTPLSLHNKKSPRAAGGVNNQPHQHPHL